MYWEVENYYYEIGVDFYLLFVHCVNMSTLRTYSQILSKMAIQ